MQQDVVRRIPLIAELSEADLELFMRRATEVQLAAGETLFYEGDPGDAVYIIVEGELSVVREIEGRMTLLDSRTSGDVIGEMAPLLNEPRKATIQARSASTLLEIDSADFADVLKYSPTASMAILRTAALRLREMESEMSLSQKMAALGTLSAGLAHELNNPSAALRRAADQLAIVFEHWKALSAEVGSFALTDEQRTIMDALMATTSRRAPEQIHLDPLMRAESEEELETWLENRSVDRAWELAAELVDTGLEASDLTPFESTLPSEHVSTLLWWAATSGTISALLAELAASAESISSIVAAVKNYTHLDQSPIQEVDIHAGIDQSLMILRHMLRQVRVHRDYGLNLPFLTAWPGALNQVWTNLITNAVDAMDGQGELTIRTRQQDNWIVVEMEDGGPGIPDEIQPRLFDPFFTTKGPGRGTGLGLHISYKIVVQEHRGTIRVNSRPGQTTFTVSLPIRMPA